MKEKVTYDVVTYTQVLFSGTWEDGNWDWELKHYDSFKDYNDAVAFLGKFTICDDLPIARLYKVTKTWDGEDWETNEELLIERS